MKCPICREPAQKISKDDDGDILVRCRTDGDFYVTPAARRKLDDLSPALRQQSLNNAILLRQPQTPPIIKKFMLASKVRERVRRTAVAED